ncbi:MAG: fibronectin type III domain-containing protein [Mogibacterium sp.]|nr:fibronectin type III domain-containing protein [Mogibacterium sp.]
MKKYLRKCIDVMLISALCMLIAPVFDTQVFAAGNASDRVVHISSFGDFQSLIEETLVDEKTGEDMRHMAKVVPLCGMNVTIILDKDITLKEDQHLSFGDGNYVLDLNGHTLKKNVKKITLEGGGSPVSAAGVDNKTSKLTIKGKGTIKCTGKESYAALDISEGCDVKLLNGTFSSNNSVIRIDGDGLGLIKTKLTIKNGTFISEGTDVIYNDEGTLIINGGDFRSKDCKANESNVFPGTYSHSCISDHGLRSRVTINGGTFDNETSDQPILECGHITIKGGSFSGKALFYAGMDMYEPYLHIKGGKFGSTKFYPEGYDWCFLDDKHLTYSKNVKLTSAQKKQIRREIRKGNKERENQKKYAPSRTIMSNLTAGKKTIAVKWEKVKKADGYEIEISQNKKKYDGKISRIFYVPDSKETITKYTEKGYTFKKLKEGSTYWIRIRAFNTVKSVDYYGAWSKAKKIKTK